MAMTVKLDFLYYVTRISSEPISMHQHECYELVYYVNGKGSSTIDNMTYLYKSGNFAIIKPNSLHDEHHNVDTDILFIGFECHNTPIPLNNGFHKDTPESSILLLLQKMKNEMLNRKPFYEITLQLILQELIIEVLRISSKKPNNNRDFSHIDNFLQENYMHHINFNTLAELAGYSYHRFRHIFKDSYGISPHQYVLQLRLKSACEILKNSNDSVLNIAYSCGFPSESQFCSMFKRTFGCTPSEFRAKK